MKKRRSLKKNNKEILLVQKFSTIVLMPVHWILNIDCTNQGLQNREYNSHSLCELVDVC